MLRTVIALFVLAVCGPTPVHSQESLLLSGNWFKLKTDQDAVHRIDYNQLISWGVINAPENSNHIRLFSHGSGMLPEENWVSRPFDLQEIAIAVFDGGDGVFEEGDYLLFWGEDQITWSFNSESSTYVHRNHLYDDFTHYFLTFDHGEGLRIVATPPQMIIPDQTINSFTDFKLHETELRNLFSSGKKWFGENFQNQLSHQFSFSFPNIINGASAIATLDLISRSIGIGNTNSFQLSVGQAESEFEVINVTSNYLNDYVRPARHVMDFSPAEESIEVNVTFNPIAENSEAWINFVTVQVQRQIVASSTEQLIFRSPTIAEPGQIFDYSVAQAGQNHLIWDVTQFSQPVEMSCGQNTEGLVFQRDTDFPRTFVCFDPDQAATPIFEGSVANQNLKGQPFSQGFIITHPDFLSQAQQLADFHQTHSGLTVNVATTQQIYNEFAGGTTDITAIKDYLRYFYDQAPTEAQRPAYLTILGDASFDYKGHVYPNSSFVPTFQSENSFALINTYCSDDYFCLLAPEKSNALGSLVDIGVGRLPAKSAQEAQIMVDKIIAYHQSDNNGKWQQSMLFVADDEDNNIHMSQADILAESFGVQRCELHIKKVFSDSFEQISTPDGDRYPQASNLINQYLNQGAFMVNYTGHSGHSNWSSEKILTDSTITALQNGSRLPLFFMANCDFSKFDAPQFISGSELLLLNPNGGAIAAVSNSRIGYSSSNFAFNSNFNDSIFSFPGTDFPRLGDLIRYAKNASVSSSIMSHRSNNLLGDAMAILKYPALKTQVTEITDLATGFTIETLEAGKTIQASGVVTDNNGSFLPSFNGTLDYLILDSRAPEITLSNDGFPAFQYFVQKDTLAYGNVEVNNGTFVFTAYIGVPGNGISGNGKLFTFAHNENYAAAGCFEDFEVSDAFTGIDEKPEMRVQIFPNPTRNGIRIVSDKAGNSYSAQLWTSTGMLIWSETVNDSEWQVSLEDLAPGTYLLRMESKTNLAVVRVVKLP